MANDLETPNIGNFSIQDTMEMGMGSTELLNDLLGPDTASASPDDIKNITVEETPAPKATKASAKVEEEEEKKEDTSKSITDFLLGGDEEEEEEEVAPIAKTKETPAAEASNEEEDDDDAINPFAAFSRDRLKPQRSCRIANESYGRPGR